MQRRRPSPATRNPTNSHLCSNSDIFFLSHWRVLVISVAKILSSSATAHSPRPRTHTPHRTAIRMRSLVLLSLLVCTAKATLLDDAEAALVESAESIEGQYREFYSSSGQEPPSCEYFDSCDNPPVSSEDGQVIPEWQTSGTPYHDLCEVGEVVTFPEAPNCPAVTHTTCAINVSYATAATKFVAGADLESDEMKLAVCVQSTLDSIWHTSFEDVLDIQSYTEYIYSSVGDTGIFNQFPGTSWGECPGSYDPRFRPWYAAAAMGPKNVVLIIDVSGSMAIADRLSLAKEAAKKVLGTLTEYDYLGIVTFSSTASTYSSTMQAYTTDRGCVLEDYIDSLTSGGGTNYGDAFEAAFDLIDDSIADGSVAACDTTLLLFLTDGKISRGLEGAPLYDQISARADDHHSHILTYALGSSVDTSVTTDIACSNDGVAFQVDDGGDLASVMASYYVFFASEVDPNAVKPMWTKYREYNSGNFVASVCMSAFDRDLFDDEGITRLLGIVCADLMEDHILAFNGSLDGLERRLNTSSSSCPLVHGTPSQLAQIRARMPGNPLACPGDPAAGSTTPSTSPNAAPLVDVPWFYYVPALIVVVVIVVVVIAVCVAKKQATQKSTEPPPHQAKPSAALPQHTHHANHRQNVSHQPQYLPNIATQRRGMVIVAGGAQPVEEVRPLLLPSDSL